MKDILVAAKLEKWNEIEILKLRSAKFEKERKIKEAKKLEADRLAKIEEAKRLEAERLAKIEAERLAKIEEEKRLIKLKKLEKVEKFKRKLFQFSDELNEINNSFNQNSILNNETFHLPKKIDKKNQQFSKK